MFTLKQTTRFASWEASLADQRARVAIASRLSRLAYGLMGDVKSVGGGVQEVRIHYGPGYRIYFQQKGQEIILLLCGGDKSSQKKDIELAKQLAKTWMN